MFPGQPDEGRILQLLAARGCASQALTASRTSRSRKCSATGRAPIPETSPVDADPARGPVDYLPAPDLCPVFQPGDDIEQCGFAATAWSDNDDKLALRDLERNIIQRVDRWSLLLNPFRNVVDHEFRRGRTLQLFLERH